MSKLNKSIIQKFSVEQKQSKVGMVVIFFDKFISIVKNYAIFLIIPMWKDFDLILLIILILLIALFTAALTVIEFKYFTFQFDFNKNDFIVKKGFLKKTKLSVPLNKIQQINLNQNFIHKFLNLYEIQMDTAGSDSKEVSIKAVKEDIAFEIKDFTDFGALEYLDALGINFIPSFSSFIKNGNFGFIAILVYIILIFLAVFATNLISTIIKFYKFSASKTNNNLSVSYGLISTKTILMNPNKVQVFSFTQNWIQKKIDLCNIIIYQASSNMNISSDKSKEGSFVSHLTELRSRLINSLIFIFIIFIIGYFFAEYIYNFLDLLGYQLQKELFAEYHLFLNLTNNLIYIFLKIFFHFLNKKTVIQI